jgi:hypothetical protein
MGPNQADRFPVAADHLLVGKNQPPFFRRGFAVQPGSACRVGQLELEEDPGGGEGDPQADRRIAQVA